MNRIIRYPSWVQWMIKCLVIENAVLDNLSLKVLTVGKKERALDLSYFDDKIHYANDRNSS